MQPNNSCPRKLTVMKNLLTSAAAALALFLIGLPLSAAAGNKAATSGMQVSFVVKEACTVQTAASQPRTAGHAATATAAAPNAAPAVACEFNTPYLLARGGQQPAAANTVLIDRAAAPIRTESGAQNWVVYF